MHQNHMQHRARGESPAIISIGSGKGGVGKSVLSSNLALLFARRGIKVALADLDLGGADLHTLFGTIRPDLTLTDFLTRRVPSLEEVALPVNFCRELRLISGTGETLKTANMPYGTKKRLIRHLRQLPVDLILIDVGAGTSYQVLDFYLMADVQIAVATPEPTSIMDVYRFIKLAAIRSALSDFVARGEVAAAITGRDFHSITEVLDVVEQADGSARSIASRSLNEFAPCLVLNRISRGHQVNTLRLKTLLRKYTGSELAILGEIPEDEELPRSVCAFLPIVEFAPASAAAQSLEKIAGTAIDRLRAKSRIINPAVA